VTIVYVSDVCIATTEGSLEFAFTGQTSTNQITISGQDFTTTDCTGTSSHLTQVYTQNTCVEQEGDDDLISTDDPTATSVATEARISKDSALATSIHYSTFVGYKSEPSVSYASLIVTSVIIHFHNFIISLRNIVHGSYYVDCIQLWLNVKQLRRLLVLKVTCLFHLETVLWALQIRLRLCALVSSSNTNRKYIIVTLFQLELLDSVATIRSYSSSTKCSGTYTSEAYSSDCSTDYYSVSCQNADSSSAAKCFSGYETVTLENGEDKLISDVVVGDRILSYSPSSKSFVFSDVVYIPHEKNNELASFNKITTIDGQVITLTPDHLIMAGDCDSIELNLKPSSMIKSGQCLLNQQGKYIQVESMVMTKLNGIYTVVTQEEFIVVSGFVSSPFAVNHYFANKYYNIHRFLYNYIPTVMKSSIFGQVQGVANYIANYATTF
jgi:Hint module